jgi:hypothetical protein
VFAGLVALKELSTTLALAVLLLVRPRVFRGQPMATWMVAPASILVRDPRPSRSRAHETQGRSVSPLRLPTAAPFLSLADARALADASLIPSACPWAPWCRAPCSRIIRGSLADSASTWSRPCGAGARPVTLPSARLPSSDGPNRHSRNRSQSPRATRSTTRTPMMTSALKSMGRHRSTAPHIPDSGTAGVARRGWAASGE